MNPEVFYTGIVGLAGMCCAAALNQRRTFRGAPASTCASAMKTTAPEEPADEPTGDMLFDDLFQLTQEGEEQMKSVPVARDDRRKIAAAMQEVQPQRVEFLGSRNLGATALVPGRAVEPRQAPTVTGGCVFNMPDLYADAFSLQNSGA